MLDCRRKIEAEVPPFLFGSTEVLALGCAISGSTIDDVPSLKPRGGSCFRGFHIYVQTNPSRQQSISSKSFDSPIPTSVTAIASISSWVPCSHYPCWLCPVWEQYVIVPGASVCTPLMGHLSYSVSAPHAAGQLLAQQYAAYAESFRAGSLSLTYGLVNEKHLTPSQHGNSNSIRLYPAGQLCPILDYAHTVGAAEIGTPDA